MGVPPPVPQTAELQKRGLVRSTSNITRPILITRYLRYSHWNFNRSLKQNAKLKQKKKMFVCPPVEKLKFWVGRSIFFLLLLFMYFPSSPASDAGKSSWCSLKSSTKSLNSFSLALVPGFLVGNFRSLWLAMSTSNADVGLRVGCTYSSSLTLNKTCRISRSRRTDVHSVSLMFCHGPFGPLATKTLSSWYVINVVFCEYIGKICCQCQRCYTAKHNSSTVIYLCRHTNSVLACHFDTRWYPVQWIEKSHKPGSVKRMGIQNRV